MKLIITIIILLSILMCTLPPFAAKLAEDVHVQFTEVLPSELEIEELPMLHVEDVRASSDEDSAFTQPAELTMLLERAKSISLMSVRLKQLSVERASTIKVYLADKGIVREMTWEDYLSGVVLAEMYAGYDAEALKAQAVACHSYALHKMSAGSYESHKGADVCTDSGHCTAYKTYADYAAAWGEASAAAAREKITAAVSEVADYVLTYEGKACNAMFHASSGEMTEAAASLWDCDLPYLSAVASFEDADVTEVSLSAAQLKGKLSGLGITFTGEAADWIEAVEHTAGGRVDHALICGSEISGSTLRSRLGLRSTDFTVAYVDGSFLFTVAGYGHGIGMSQAGAAAMAEMGADWRAILAHYYPGSELAIAN